MTTEQSTVVESSPRSRIIPITERMADWPWWLLVIILIGLIVVYSILTDQKTSVIFLFLIKGVQVTLTVTLIAYSMAISIGLIVGLARVSSNRLVLNIASFYVEIIRGIPLLVLLIYIAFVGVPLIIDGIKSVGEWLLLQDIGLGASLAGASTRDISNAARATFGLGIAYGAFSSEIFRAGIQSIDKGQMEAARALGMSYFQAMRYVVLPQAIRNVLPALGNDFIAMLKDSSLVSVLGVQDLTQLARLYSASTFLFFQTYSILAFTYLTMTILLSRLVRQLETRLSRHRR